MTPYLNARGPPALVGDVAADRAELERAGIGRVEQALRLDRLLQLAGDDARLDHRDEVARIDLLDLLHALGRQHDAALRPAAHRRTMPLPAPRGVTGTLCSAQMRSTAATCSVDSQSTAHSGG